MAHEKHLLVKDRYARLARFSQAQYSPGSCCCGPGSSQSPYSAEDLASLPLGGLTSLGCGNPVDAAEIQPGETVLDLGSGSGLDVLLAARRAGPGGRVIGVDMTPEMLARARENLAQTGLNNVEFREGIIERIPLEACSVDLVLSNCVVNLSPDKEAVFSEVCRVLKPGGRLVVSDVVAAGTLPDHVRRDPQLWSSCVAGALPEQDYLRGLRRAGLTEIEVLRRNRPGKQGVYGITLRAGKPRALNPLG